VTLTVNVHVATKIVQEQQNEAQRVVIIDSGAWGTVFCSPEMFDSIEPPGQDVCIRFGTGPRRGVVVLCVTCMDTSKRVIIHIPNACYVPTQPLNMVSAHDITDIGGAAVFDHRYGMSFVMAHECW
jgi:hypothetical protein